MESIFFVTDIDVILDSYNPVRNNNWIKIDERDGTRLIGSFNLTMARDSKTEKLGDPSRPDTLYFENGYFDVDVSR